MNPDHLFDMDNQSQEHLRITKKRNRQLTERVEELQNQLEFTYRTLHEVANHRDNLIRIYHQCFEQCMYLERVVNEKYYKSLCHPRPIYPQNFVRQIE